MWSEQSLWAEEEVVVNRTIQTQTHMVRKNARTYSALFYLRSHTHTLSSRTRQVGHYWPLPPAGLGFLSTRMTESPRKNIFEMKRSLLTGLAFFFPFPDFGFSVHISFTFSRTMLQCRSKAFTRPSSFLLFRQLMSTCVLFLTDWVRTESGPVWNSSSSRGASLSGSLDMMLAVS